MQEFRRLVKGPVGKILLGAIIIAFTASGFYGYFTTSGEQNVVAEVEGSPVYRQQLSQQVQRYRARVRQQQPNLDPAMLESFITPSRVLEGLINNELLLAYARDADLAVSEEQAVLLLRDAPAFQDDKGKFSRALFEQTVRNMGMTPQGYVDGLRKDLLLNQTRMAYQVTDFALPRELAEQRRLGEQTRSFRYLQLPVAELAASIEVTEEEVESFYQENQGDFMRPERFRIAYIELDPADYDTDIEISDEAVQREYEARKQMMETAASQAQGREAAHILVETGDRRGEDEAIEKARSLYQRIQAGESFAEVAREASEDPGSREQGGKLGLIEQGTLPEPMEEALFQLEPGQVSEPVVTDAGVHLVKLLAVEDKKTPSLEELRDQIIADLKKAKVDARVAEDVNRLETLAYDHPGLETPAEKLGVEVQTTDWFSLQGATGIAGHPAVREAVQSTLVEDGQNSELLELGNGRYAVIRLAERQAEEPLALSEVENSIRTRIRRSRAREQLDQMAEQARAALDKGALQLEELEQQWGVRVQIAEAVERGADEPNARLVSEAFGMPRPGNGSTGPRMIRLPDGGLAALTLTGVTDGNPEGLSAEQRAVALAELGNREGERSFRQLMAWLRDTLSIDINESVLSDLEGNESGAPEA